MHRGSFSSLSIKLSSKDFLYMLSKDLVVSWSLSNSVLYFFQFFIITSYTTLLPIDNPHAIPIDIGITIKPIPVRLNVIELDVLAIKTNVSKDSNIVVIVLSFLYFCLDLLFLSLKYVNNFLMLLIWLLKLLKLFISFPIFVLNHYFLMVHMGILYHVFGSFIYQNL